jgi:outer membrane protein TolC
MSKTLSMRCTALLAAALAAGCATFSEDGGFGPVAATARDRLDAELRWERSDADREANDRRVAELLAAPLGADQAVQVALLRNRGLQAAFAELGIREAERVQAGRLPNPGFSFARLTRGDEVELERSLHVDLARVLLMPLVAELESRRFDAARRHAATQVLALAAETRKAWVQAVAAEQSLRYARQIRQAAEASAELARRMAEAGNFSALQRAREQAFRADAALAVARATQARHATRERLIRLLGVWGDETGFVLPERLPELPAEAAGLSDLERRALEQRLDVQAARLAVEQLASNIGIAQATRFVHVLEFGVEYNGSNLEPTQRGWEIGFELPLFDFGDARIARAQAQYEQAVHRAAQTAIEARSEVREAYVAARTAYDVARHHRDEIVPLARRIADENLLRYNGMLIGVFELLADARAQIGSVNAAIDAQRDYWLAQADLDMALVGRPNFAPTTAATASPPAASAGGGH